MDQKENELTDIWFCSRKRKCGWRGEFHQLRDVSIGPRETEGRCPDCGHNEFYVKKDQPRPQPDFQI